MQKREKNLKNKFNIPFLRNIKILKTNIHTDNHKEVLYQMQKKKTSIIYSCDVITVKNTSLYKSVINIR